MINLQSLFVTQAQLRHIGQVSAMVEFVRDGGKFIKESLLADRPPSLIGINEFEDGQRFILDGHHRCVSVQEAGRDFLDDAEYYVTHYTYNDFAQIIFQDRGHGWWITPFDPRKEMRIENLQSFKDSIHSIVKHQGEAHARHLIITQPSLYLVYRDRLPSPVDTVTDLRIIWHKQLKEHT